MQRLRGSLTSTPEKDNDKRTRRTAGGHKRTRNMHDERLSLFQVPSTTPHALGSGIFSSTHDRHVLQGQLGMTKIREPRRPSLAYI